MEKEAWSVAHYWTIHTYLFQLHLYEVSLLLQTHTIITNILPYKHWSPKINFPISIEFSPRFPFSEATVSHFNLCNID